MGQPLPPGDLPLIEGLDSSWNEFVSYIPEDKRGEFAPKFKERISSYETQLNEYKPWQEFQKAGVTPEQADAAMNLFSIIENNPKQVYDAIGNHLGLTAAEAKEVVKQVQDGDPRDSQIAALQEKFETLAQIAVAQKQQTTQEKEAQEYDAWVDGEINTIKKKYGADIPEEQIIMRMAHMEMTAEEAYQDYAQMVTNIRSKRPSPMVMGPGGPVPPKSVDVKALNSKETKSLVAQMLEHSNSER